MVDELKQIKPFLADLDITPSKNSVKFDIFIIRYLSSERPFNRKTTKL
jgi:hypothetical protein